MSRYERFLRDGDWFYEDLDLGSEALLLDNCDCSIEDYVRFKAKGLKVLCMGYSLNGLTPAETVNIFILLERCQGGEVELLLVEDYQRVTEGAPLCVHANWSSRAVPLWKLLEDMETWRYKARYSNNVLYEIKHFLGKLEERSAPVPTGRKLRA